MNILAIAIGFILALPFGIALARNIVLRDNERQAGHARCHYCRSRLKRDGPLYATTCSKCGRTQAWASLRHASR